MIKLYKEDTRVIPNAALQYLDNEVFDYVKEHGVTKDLKHDVIITAYNAIEEDVVNGAPYNLAFWRMWLRLTAWRWIPKYINRLTQQKQAEEKS